MMDKRVHKVKQVHVDKLGLLDLQVTLELRAQQVPQVKLEPKDLLVLDNQDLLVNQDQMVMLDLKDQLGK